MEIGSLQPKGKASEHVDLESLNKTVQRLNIKLGKLAASLRMPAVHEVSRDTYQQHSIHEGPHKADAYYGGKQQVNPFYTRHMARKYTHVTRTFGGKSMLQKINQPTAFQILFPRILHCLHAIVIHQMKDKECSISNI